MLSVCYRFEFGIVGLLSVSIPALCWWLVSNQCYVGYLSVSNRAIPYRILPEMSPTRTRLVLRCLQQHCRWPTAGRLIENFAFFVGFVSVWPVWLGYYRDYPSISVMIWVLWWRYGRLVTWFCDHLIAKLGKKTATPPSPDPSCAHQHHLRRNVARMTTGFVDLAAC